MQLVRRRDEHPLTGQRAGDCSNPRPRLACLGRGQPLRDADQPVNLGLVDVVVMLQCLGDSDGRTLSPHQRCRRRRPRPQARRRPSPTRPRPRPSRTACRIPCRRGRRRRSRPVGRATRNAARRRRGRSRGPRSGRGASCRDLRHRGSARRSGRLPLTGQPGSVLRAPTRDQR